MGVAFTVAGEQPVPVAGHAVGVAAIDDLLTAGTKALDLVAADDRLLQLPVLLLEKAGDPAQRVLNRRDRDRQLVQPFGQPPEAPPPPAENKAPMADEFSRWPISGHRRPRMSRSAAPGPGGRRTGGTWPGSEHFPLFLMIGLMGVLENTAGLHSRRRSPAGPGRGRSGRRGLHGRRGPARCGTVAAA